MTIFDLTVLDDTVIAHKKGITIQQGRQLRDNPLAIAEGSSGAPVLSGAWHPYNKVNVGDSNTGVIWDSAVDAATTTIESPNFEDGYEYALRFEAMGVSGGAIVKIDVYLATTAVWQTMETMGWAISPLDTHTGVFSLRYPRLAVNQWAGNWDMPLSDDDGTLVASGGAVTGNATKQVLTKFRVSSTAQFNLGKLALLRRREYVTG